MRYGLLIIVLLMIHGQASAHDDHKHVVPEHEYVIAQEAKAGGPKVSQGIESIAALGSVSLEGELPGLTNRMLRARELVIAPGGVVAVHQHDGRPGMAYILEGEIIEHRSDAEAPITRSAGAVSFEKTGLTHWWENKSDKPVKALVVDIVPGE